MLALLLGLILTVLGAYSVFAAFRKPANVWRTKAVQGVQKTIGSNLTTALVLIFGLVILGFGISLVF
jgi:hypothetical protein